MRRRLMLARALLNEPRLLILDEPTTGLDPQARRLVWERIRTLKRAGTTILLTTHYMEEAASCAIGSSSWTAAASSPRATRPTLIAGRVGTEVVEVHLPDDVDADGDASRGSGTDRGAASASAGCSTSTCATATPTRCSTGSTASTSTRRRATLEDVFLTLTGHTTAGLSMRPGIGALRVWRRNFESWKRFSLSFLVASLGNPLFYLASIGYGLGSLRGDIDGLPYAVFLTPGILATAAMNSASFETTFGSFTRLHEQNTYAAILATPCSVADIVAGDILWAATKSVPRRLLRAARHRRRRPAAEPARPRHAAGRVPDRSRVRRRSA